MSITNNKYTKWIIGALVLLNLVLLSVLFFLRPKHDGGGGRNPSDFLKKELNLSDDQVVKFKELRKAHFQKSREELKAIRVLKNEMLDAVSAESPDTLKANLIADQIGIKEANKEKLLVQHYLKLQAECTPEQRQKLERVFKNAMSRKKFRKGKRKKKEKETE
ncbi:MAG: Spy/CpxP family protein refolding chaperone [Saprospiraceae bacterium]